MATPEQGRKWTVGGLLIALGLVFGDIGTSPLYVLKVIIGSEKITKELIFGSLSCIFWTLIVITTFKYVYLALKADNRGEGGVFALYARVRRYKARWAIYPALIGCATLIADGFITPSISISAAVEGVHRLHPTLDLTPIIIGILLLLFISQQFGLQIFAKFFGPVMFVWFGFIAILGFEQIAANPSVLAALNPIYAWQFITQYQGQIGGETGFWLLGAVFLCTTGAEALYSDLGRCGKMNIRLTWIFVLPCLLLSYFGQGAWVMQFEGQSLSAESQLVGTFFEMLPLSMVMPVTVLATLATVIVSQALITGIFTMVHEAMQLKLWFNMKVQYPTQMRGQVYIPFINWFLLAGCITAVLVFENSTEMESAYGFAIVVDMIMTSSLLLHFIHMRNQSLTRAIVVGCIFGFVEIAFLISSINKIPHGGWFSLLIAIFIFGCVFIYFQARKIRDKHANFLPFSDYIPVLKDLMKDETVPRMATNLVYLAMSGDEKMIDANIVYSLFRKRPKRADIYWFVHVEIGNNPFARKYKVTPIIPGKAFFVHLKIGFKIEHKINRMFLDIVERMQNDNEIDERSHYPSLRRYELPADFKFIILNSRISADDELSPWDQFVVRAYRVLKHVSLPMASYFGLEMANVAVETVPISVSKPQILRLDRER